MSDPDAARLRAIAAGFSGKRILVVGDVMLDEFIWGRVSRISPEAPVPVVNVAGETYYPGGAANVARNVREFTPHTMVMGRVGPDRHGCQLFELLAGCGIATTGLQQDPGAVTTVKTRIMARNQQIVRVDREDCSCLTPERENEALGFLERVIPEVDAVIVADYGKGFVTQHLADRISAISRRAGCVLTVDPHPYTRIRWNGVTAAKPNRLEAFLAAGLPPADALTPVLADEALLEAGRRLIDRWQPGHLLITLGEHGMLLFGDGAQPSHIPTCARTVFDVSGAGDTAIAIFTLALAARAGAAEAAHLANLASGVVVGKLGTAALTQSELLDAIEQGRGEKNDR